MGSKSVSTAELELFLDLKNFLGLESEPEEEIKGAERSEVKEAEPHFPTIPADFEAETPENIVKLDFLKKDFD